MKQDVARQRLFAEKTWSIFVCPVCAVKAPKHADPCLSDDPPGLRPLHVEIDVVAAKWRDLAKEGS